ncbi:putative oxidoreductase OrdL [Diplonema papillatum]|nr:putative oxidoreductase OrdL [Diplonema papillatum]
MVRSRFGYIAASGAAGLLATFSDVFSSTEVDLKRRLDGHPDTYWASVCKEPAVERPRLTGRTVADVAVVGGGLAGLHTALKLAEKGKRVVVLEREKVGWGASGMSKGLAVSGFQVEEESIKALAGKDVARAAVEMTEEALLDLERLIAKYAIKCDVTRGGELSVSLHPSPALSSDSDWGPERISREVGTRSYKSGELDPSAFGVNPLALTRGLARACEKLGVSIFEETEVARLQTRLKYPGKWAVDCGAGDEVIADNVVMCGAAHLSSSVSAKLRACTVPVFTYMAATAPLGDRLPLKKDPAGARPPPLVCDTFTALRYWRASTDGENRLLFGALADVYPCPMDVVEQRLQDSLKFVYPQLFERDSPPVRFDYIWGGTLSMSRHAVPLIGRDRPGLYYATAFGGHGIVPTCLAGRVIADAIAGSESDLSMFEECLPPVYCGWPFSRLGAAVVLGFFDKLEALEVAGYTVPHVPKPW